MKGLSSKGTALRVDVLQNRKYTAFEGRPSIFQPAILQAVAVKGLKFSFQCALGYRLRVRGVRLL